MDNIVVLEEYKTDEHMDGDSPDIFQFESSEISTFDHIIQVHIHEVKCQCLRIKVGSYNMFSKDKSVSKLDDISSVSTANLFDFREDRNLVQTLFIVLILSFENLQSYFFFVFMVIDLQYLRG